MRALYLQSHSTATQAATFFLACRARFLALTRFGGMNGEPQFTNRKVKQEVIDVYLFIKS
ncbi:hypothetical protein EON65_24515 [archaeon]|nr:MAG: hypothetical protein EON65_24515 [archaeon]